MRRRLARNSRSAGAATPSRRRSALDPTARDGLVGGLYVERSPRTCHVHGAPAHVLAFGRRGARARPRLVAIVLVPPHVASNRTFQPAVRLGSRGSFPWEASVHAAPSIRRSRRENRGRASHRVRSIATRKRVETTRRRRSNRRIDRPCSEGVGVPGRVRRAGAASAEDEGIGFRSSSGDARVGPRVSYRFDGTEVSIFEPVSYRYDPRVFRRGGQRGDPIGATEGTCAFEDDRFETPRPRGHSSSCHVGTGLDRRGVGRFQDVSPRPRRRTTTDVLEQVGRKCKLMHHFSTNAVAKVVRVPNERHLAATKADPGR